jgi:hypothetical protein
LITGEPVPVRQSPHSRAPPFTIGHRWFGWAVHSKGAQVVAKTSRNTWWFFVLLIVLLVTLWYGISAVRTDECSSDQPREWVWFPPKWECTRQF